MERQSKPMSELSQYQKRKQVTDLMKTLDKGQKGVLFELLLEEWAETLPHRLKDWDAPKDGRLQARLEWLQEHWGTAFETGKGGQGLRRMPLGNVVGLLTTFCLKAADNPDSEVDFGMLDDESEIGMKVATGLEQMSVANGPQVTISLHAWNQMQAIRREWKEQGGKDVAADTSIIKKIFDQLESMPSVKDEKEIKRYVSRKKKVSTEDKAFSK